MTLGTRSQIGLSISAAISPTEFLTDGLTLVEISRARMLEISVSPNRPPRWEWQVISNGEVSPSVLS
jgi:hypothetical protein